MADAGPAAPARVRYRERQIVARADLAAEQQYLVAARRRHGVGPHTWGIVAGLEVTAVSGVVSVRAGSALDGFGRELTLDTDLEVSSAALLQLNADRVALWMTYDRVDRIVPLGREWNCAPGAENRTSESVRLRLTTIEAGGSVEPRYPPDVTAADRDFGPERDPPDDPSIVWPVFLGVVERAGAGAPWRLNAAFKARRPYAGLRGQTITAASGIVRVRAGHELEGDDRAFAVDVGTTGALTERLAIDSTGSLFFARKTTISPRAAGRPVEGNLQIQRAEPDVRETRRAGLAGCEESGAERRPRFWGVRFDRIAPPETARPWHVYHAGVPALPPPVAPAVPFDDLRVEFLDPGKKANRKGNRFVIGARDPAGRLVRCVTIDAECTVTIGEPPQPGDRPAGKLQVNGQIIMGPVQADASDPRLQVQILGGWLQGMLANTRQLAEYYDGRLTLTAAAPGRAFVDSPFEIEVRVINAGTIPLVGVIVSETHNLSGVQATLPPAFTLGPHEQKDVEVSYTVAAPGHFSCQITATGLAQGASYSVNASAGAAVEVVHQARIQAQVQVQTHAVVGAQVPYVVAARNTGKEPLSRVFLTASVNDGTTSTEQLLSDDALQRDERLPFNRNLTRATPVSVTIGATAGGSGTGPANDATATDSKIVVFHTAASITVTITNLNPGIANTPMPFTIAVQNTSPDPVTVTTVTLTKSATSPNGSFSPVATGQVIAPAATLNLNASFTPSAMTAPETLTVTATIHVAGAGGDDVSASDTKSSAVAIN